MNIDEIKYTFSHIWHKRLRSFLTILSIVIGVMSIFAIISFGLGIKNYVDVLAKQTGSDKLYIQAKGMGAPGADTTFTLSDSDVSFLEKINGVADVIPVYTKPVGVKFKEEEEYTFGIGIDVVDSSTLFETYGIEVYLGRELKSGDIYKAVLGYAYTQENKVFKKALKVGDNIAVNGVTVQVVGFYSEVGNPQDDSQIYFTDEGFEAVFPDYSGKYSWMLLRADPNVKASELSEKIKEKFRKHKNEDEGKETFFVQSFDDVIKTFTSIIDVLNGVLILIALVSMVVAFVNIMNAMFTAVLERTKEIGIMKAIGAKNRSIMFIFIFEAGLLGLIGGLFGILGGYVVASIGGNIAASSGYSLLKPFFPWYLTLGCLTFAFLVGSASGFIPAKRASELKPVDALRYE